MAKKLLIEQVAQGPILARFFSRSVLQEMAVNGRSLIAARMAQQYGLTSLVKSGTTVRDFYDLLFSHLSRHYRHEYVYKNAIAEKLFLGTHSLRTAFMLTEFRVDGCKADAVLLNGTSHVYEIKSELDNLDRLERQLVAYGKIFDRITVITTERLFPSIEKRIPDNIGIMVLAEGKYRFRRTPKREATSNKSHIDPGAVFDALQRREYMKIIKEATGASLTHVPNTQIHAVARQIFVQFSAEAAHDAMVKALKSRNNARHLNDLVEGVPNSLKAAALSIRMTRSERLRFMTALGQDVRIAFR